MAWVRLSDDFTEHPKLLEAGPLAGWLWVSALAWSNRNGTDGKIPRAALPRLAVFDGIGVYTSNYTGQDVEITDLADILVDVGLFETFGNGWMIHDYDQYQLTTDELARRSEAKRRAGRAGGLASGKARSDSAPTEADVPPSAQASGEADASAGAQAESKPGPGPEPPVSSQSSVDVPGTCPQVPDDVWTEYAKLKRAQSKEVIRNITSYDRRTIENAKLEHGALAARWWETFDISPNQLACALVAGKAGPYWSPRQVPA